MRRPTESRPVDGSDGDMEPPLSPYTLRRVFSTTLNARLQTPSSASPLAGEIHKPGPGHFPKCPTIHRGKARHAIRRIQDASAGIVVRFLLEQRGAREWLFGTDNERRCGRHRVLAND